MAGFWSVDELLDRSSTGQCFALRRGRHLADQSQDGSGSRANGKLTSRGFVDLQSSTDTFSA